MKKIASVLFVVGCFAVTSSAADFYPIAGVSASSGETDLWPASNLIQGPGVGFDAAEPHDKTSAGSEGNWVTADPGGFPSDYIEAGGQPTVTFDLGADVPLSEISLWGYSAGNTNGVSEFSVSFATAAEGAGGGSVSAGPFNLAGSLENGTNDDTARQSFSFAEVTARYVDVHMLDNFFVAPGDGTGGEGHLRGGDRVGLGEVAFQQPVPEPASLTLLGLAGLALGALRRRRK